MFALQFKKSTDKKYFLLGLILLVFFLKGLLLSALYPLFWGPDEPKHYNTIQYLAEPAEKNWPIDKARKNINNKEIATFNFTEEIEKTASAINFDDVRWKPHRSIPFIPGWNGQNERTISEARWSRVNQDSRPSIIGKARLFHQLATRIESSLAEHDIFIRFYAIRIFSLLIGTLCLLLFYFITVNCGFSEKAGLLAAALAAFQPGLAATSVFVNYDILLIFSFTLFTYGAVLTVRKGLDIKYVALMIAAITIGLFAKGTAIVLIPVFAFLIILRLFKKSAGWKKIFIYILLTAAVAVSGLFIFNNKYGFRYITSAFSGRSFESISSSVQEYLTKSTLRSRLELTSVFYWGNNRWTNDIMSDRITKIIWLVEAAAVIGIIFFLFYPRKPDFLPDKKIIILLLAILAALQFGIHFYDWKIFNDGRGFELGAAGRYFMPNIFSHLIIMLVGIGALARKEKWFEMMLKIFFVALLSLSLYSIYDVIIYRFYS